MKQRSPLKVCKILLTSIEIKTPSVPTKREFNYKKDWLKDYEQSQKGIENIEKIRKSERATVIFI